MKIKTSSLLLLGFAVVLAGCAAFVARGLLAPHAAERPAAAVTHLQDATGILGTQRPAAKTVITYQGAAVAPVTF